MRKSRSEKAETRQRIVSVASKMFLEQGLGTVSMRDIMSAADLTQGGFYRHFESKEELIAETNSQAFDRLLAMLETETAGKSPSEAVERIVFLYLNQTRGKERAYLCPLSMIGSELHHGDFQVRARAFTGYQDLVRLLAKHFTTVSRPKALATAGGVVSTMVGAVTLAGVAPDQETASAGLTGAMVFIKQHLADAGVFKKRAHGSGGEKAK